MKKNHQVTLSEAGHEHAEQVLAQLGLLRDGESLYDRSNIMLMHHLMAALRAHSLFHLDQHYVIKDGEIVIVDEHTGRLMDGRRWSDGLHQAVEAKEGVEIKKENQNAGEHYVPKLLPFVYQIIGYDGYSRHRSL